MNYFKYFFLNLKEFDFQSRFELRDFHYGLIWVYDSFPVGSRADYINKLFSGLSSWKE